MAAVTTKRTKASAVKQASIKDTNAFLESLPEKPKEDLSLREAVEQMRESVRGALAKGYTYQELAAMLTEQGIRISAFTLKNYVPSGRRRSLKEQQPAKPVQRRGRKSAKAEASTTSTASEAAASAARNGAVSAKAEDAAKPPRGRAKATTAAKAKSSSEATVKESATPELTPKRRRATSTARAASRPATTRGRKKA